MIYRLSIVAISWINFPFSREHFITKNYKIDGPLLVLVSPMVYHFFSNHICRIDWYPHVLPIIRKTHVERTVLVSKLSDCRLSKE